jgi:hypothetical protein
LLLVSFVAGLLYMIYSVPRLLHGTDLETSLGALVGWVLAGYFSWRE